MNEGRHDTETALVTGANKGIGREVARQLAATGMAVFLGARDEQRGRAAAQDLAAGGRDVRYLPLDVTDEPGVAQAAKRVAAERDRLDVLVNNAGIAVEWGFPPPEVTTEQLRRTFEVNVFGVVTVTRSFLPLLRRSPAPRVVNVSSLMGSLHLQATPDSEVAQRGLLAYSSSKSALNAVTLLLANALREEGVAVSAVSPGAVATDLNDHRGVRTVEEGAEAPVRIALRGTAAPTGEFLGLSDGQLEPVPW